MHRTDNTVEEVIFIIFQCYLFSCPYQHFKVDTIKSNVCVCVLHTHTQEYISTYFKQQLLLQNSLITTASFPLIISGFTIFDFNFLLSLIVLVVIPQNKQELQFNLDFKAKIIFLKNLIKSVV